MLRLWGVKAGIIARCGVRLAYHELRTCAYTWLLLLMPVALLRVVPEGMGRGFILAWKYAAILLLAICLIPFLALQVQTAIYPQLEVPGTPYTQRSLFPVWTPDFQGSMAELSQLQRSGEYGAVTKTRNMRGMSEPTSNLAFDASAKIQTGPAEPGWPWNQVYCEWNSPVSAERQINPILISLFWHRVIIVLRRWRVCLCSHDSDTGQWESP